MLNLTDLEIEHITIGPVETGQKRTLANHDFEVTNYGTLEYKPDNVWELEYCR